MTTTYRGRPPGPTLIQAYGGSLTALSPANVLAGPEPRIGDDSDTSYAELHSAGSGPGVNAQWPVVRTPPAMPESTSGLPWDKLVGFRTYLRCAVSDVAAGCHVDIYSISPSAASFAAASGDYGIYGTITPDSTAAKEYLYDWTELYGPEVLTSVGTLLRDQVVEHDMIVLPTFNAYPTDVGTPVLTVYELWLEYDFDTPPITGRPKDSIRIFS